MNRFKVLFSKNKIRDRVLRYLYDSEKRIQLSGVWNNVPPKKMEKHIKFLERNNFIKGSEGKGGFRIDHKGKVALEKFGSYKRFVNDDWFTKKSTKWIFMLIGGVLGSVITLTTNWLLTCQ